MYQTPTRTHPQQRRGGAGGGGGNKNSPTTTTTTTDDGPIIELCTIIEHTASDDWVRRITAFEVLVEQIPALGSSYLHHSAWYNSPKLLLHLSYPIQELIKDPRSTVVRRVCNALTLLFTRCQSDARLLFKDIMITVLIVQGQTVQTIRNAVTTMIVDAIPQVPCKSIMPFWMERLKDKSPTIRDACSLYLGVALQTWSSIENATYITTEIWNQVGMALIKTLRDPSPNVRQQTKMTLLYMQSSQPTQWDVLIHDPNGPAVKDQKLLHWLRALGNTDSNNPNSNNEYNNNNNIPDDLSIASKYTYNSESRFAAAAAGTANGTTITGTGRTTTTTTANHPLLRISSPRLLQLQTNQRSMGSGGGGVGSNSYNGVVGGIEDLSINGGGGGGNSRIRTNSASSIPFSIAVTTTTNAAAPPDPPETKSTSATGTTFGALSQRTTSATAASNSNNKPLTQSGRGGGGGSVSGTPPRPKSSMMVSNNKNNNNNYNLKSQLPSTPQAQTYSALALQASQDDDDNDNDGYDYGATNNKNIKDDSEIFDYSESQNSNSGGGGDHHPFVAAAAAAASLVVDDSPFIASMHELKKHASQRRSRNSIVMQERFLKSSQQQQQSPQAAVLLLTTTNNSSSSIGNGIVTPTSSRDDSNATVGEIENHNNSNNNSKTESETSDKALVLSTTLKTNAETEKVASIQLPSNSRNNKSSSSLSQSTPTQPPEHIVIAIRLLRAHKSHVDQIMETLKLEMDTLRDFDALLEQPGRPTEEELITYYESIDLCVMQRYNANMTLRSIMNQLSTGGSSIDNDDGGGGGNK